MEAEGDQGLGPGELEFQASGGQVACSVNMLSRIDEHEVWNGASILGNDFHRGRFPGESSQMAELQGAQRAKRQNCGNSGRAPWNTGYSSGDQIGSIQNRMRLEAERGSGYCPVPIFASYHGMTDQSIIKLPQSGFHTETSLTNSGVSMPSHWHSNSLRSHSGVVGEHSGCSDATFSRLMPQPEYGVRDRRGQIDSSGSFLLSNSMANPVDNPTNMHLNANNGRRGSCKRKSSMDDSTISLRPSTYEMHNMTGRWEADFGTCSRGSGSSRVDHTANMLAMDSGSSIAVWDEPYHPRNDFVLPSLRSNLVSAGSSSNSYGRHPGLQQERPQLCPSGQHGSRAPLSSLPSQTSMPRRLLTSELSTEAAGIANLNINQVPETVAFGQSNGTGVSNYPGNNSFPGHHTHPGMFSGYHARTRPSNLLGIMLDQSTFELAGRSTPTISNRGSNVRDPRAQASHMVCPPSAPRVYTHISSLPPSRRNDRGLLPPVTSTTASNILPGPQGDNYSSAALINRPSMPSPFAHGSGEVGLASSSMQTFTRMPLRSLQIYPADGVNRQRFASNDLLDQSLPYNGIDIHDQHSDMRIDVDNMTYEELLALEERIGNVNTGLSDDSIAKCLKVSRHSSLDLTASVLSQDSEVKCSICQEEYMEEDELGKLNCGHVYHTACIKQWLVLKNQCPICKASAYTDS